MRDTHMATSSKNIQSDVDRAISAEEMNIWFTSFVDRLKVDHLMMETDTAPKEVKDLYTALISNDAPKVFGDLRKATSQYFIKQLIIDYISEFKAKSKLPITLALGISDSKILVWSEIEDGDEEMEDLLILSEAKINHKYGDFGFYINSTIVEHSENISTPPHYKILQ